MNTPHPLLSRPAGALNGLVAAPGDKSISHRALMFGALAVGETQIEGLLEGEDVIATARALRALGAGIERLGEGTWRVSGRGVGGLIEPGDVLDLGNSGTSARLLMGILATHPFTTLITGDASLRRRPMNRVMDPLMRIGAVFAPREGGRMPLAITGTAEPVPIEYTLPVPSAQVKSAILLAGLAAPGRTSVIEREPSRDHSERMLRHFGAEVTIEDLGDGRRLASVVGQPELRGAKVGVPGDISSAAFVVVAAAIVPGSRVTVRGVGVNPLRSGLIETLREMGANIALAGLREQGGEPVADITCIHAALKGVDVPAERAPRMIDEYPILAAAAACAEGTTRMHGLRELRVKESDRLAAIARGLAAAGVKIEEGEDWLAVHGTGAPPKGDVRIAVNLDHRIAMAFLVLGAASRKGISVDDAQPIETSFPGFAALMNGLGARIGESGPP
ncbi:MAG: 3-phosphoshikimate 1-carboxyvinyltransferase [Rhodospirillales bacterium]|nr:3-phosphoshikimate 1-carboxyvinyltransferase [Rhodospirillales bacterium]MSP80851.1 3-phosphoshikimate 1-carboxyvinyltransferase [Rhodospirillales bacterium]